MRPALWARRGVYLCALLGALAGQLFDVGWLCHYIFFLTLTLPLLGLLATVGKVEVNVPAAPAAPVAPEAPAAL